MGVGKSLIKIKAFNFEWTEQSISFIETLYVKDIANCDAYTSAGDAARDWNYKYQRWKEKYITKSVRGIKNNKMLYFQKRKVYIISSKPFSVTVEIGNLM